MSNAHAEIGALQQLKDAGLAKGSNLTFEIVGRDVCGYCRGDIAAFANKAGVNSLLIHSRANTPKSEPIIWYWNQGMKSLKKRN